VQDLILPYQAGLYGLLVLAGLIAIQFMVADVAGIRAKHVPGMPVTGGHDSFHFRAVRAHANTYEQLGLFVLLVLLCLLAGAHPKWTGHAIWLFTLARAGHMACYYADLRAPRSAAFGAGQLAQVWMLVLAAFALLA